MKFLLIFFVSALPLGYSGKSCMDSSGLLIGTNEDVLDLSLEFFEFLTMFAGSILPEGNPVLDEIVCPTLEGINSVRDEVSILS